MTSDAKHRRVVAAAALAFVSVAIFGVAAAATAHKVTIKAGLAGDREDAEAYMNANVKFVREVMPKDIRQCALKPSSGKAASFRLTLTVGHGGDVTATTTEPKNAFTSCVAEAAKHHTFTEPPKVPSDVVVDVSIDE